MAIEEYKRRWQILVSSQGVVQGFRANIVRLYKKSPDNYTRVKKQLWEKQWVVLPKKPGSPKSVVEYLGRYTHKIAISNHRIM
jgi:acyl carrier protein phosphodiesterase